MQTQDINSIKKEAKIKKLKELRKMMQKKMLESFSSGDSKKMVSKVLEKSEPKKEAQPKKESPDELKSEMKAFFQRGNSLPPSGKTKVVMPSAPSGSSKAQPARKK